MIPEAMVNYFVASTGAGAALVGLIFVAISLSPKETVMVGAAPERRAVAGSSFTALLNAFLISLSALNTSQNIAWNLLVMSLLGLLNSLLLCFLLFRQWKDWRSLIANIVMMLASLIVYAFECYYAVRLFISPHDVVAVNEVAQLLIYVYAIGLVRAWELLGAERIGIGRLFNPLRGDR